MVQGIKPNRKVTQTEKYCVYGLICPLSMQIKYIGMTKSIANRMKQHVPSDLSNTSKKQLWIKVLKQHNLKPIPVILYQFSIKSKCVDMETRMVQQFHAQLYNRFSHNSIASCEGIEIIRAATQVSISINGILYTS